MNKAEKTEIITKYQRQDSDTGSPEVQIAILTFRITELTEHLRANHKDNSTRRGLLAMVARRRKLLKYINKENHETYLSLVKDLKLRIR